MGTPRFDIHIPFVDLLGIELLEKADGRARIGFTPAPGHLNSWKGIHGGVVMSLLDTALSTASRSLDATCIGCTTVEMKTNFLAAATGSVFTVARAQRAGRSLIYAEGEVIDGQGQRHLQAHLSGRDQGVAWKPRSNALAARPPCLAWLRCWWWHSSA
jgi:uncharacterized protein (TIGR00369 family)